MRIGLAGSVTLIAMLLLASVQPTQKIYAEYRVAILPLSVTLGNVVDSPVFMSAAIANENGFEQPFVAVFEVRDANGITVLVRMEPGVLAPGGPQTPRASWVPESAGQYTARMFVISSISQPEVLSQTQSAQLIVRESLQPEPPAVFSLKEAPTISFLYQLRQYALGKINDDREVFGLPPVELSRNIAAQELAKDILTTKVLSHWTAGGEKPYMSYSRYGGLGMVTQNVAMSGSPEYYADCSSGVHMCDTVDPFEQIDLHQHGMMEIDAGCCGDGSRDNILDPFHTEVSIGIAYDDYTFVLVQNFENNYIELDESPAKRASYVELVGDIPRGQIHAINVHYDEKPSAAIYEQNKGKRSYGLGELVATVVSPGGNSSSAAIEADVWNHRAYSVEIGLSLNSVNERRGVYTIVVLFEDGDGSVFPAMSYSLL